MVNRLKIVESARYHLTSCLNSIFNVFLRKCEKNSNQTAATVFATGLSLVITYIISKIPSPFNRMGNCHIVFTTIVEGLILLGGFALSFFVGCVVYRKISRRVQRFINDSKENSNERTELEYKHLIDDFDHIACESILFAEQYADAFLGETINDSKYFNYYETIYYLGKSVNVTLNLFWGDNRKHCINSVSASNRIAIHRIDNIINMMCSIFKMIEDNRQLIKIDETLSVSLEEDIQQLKKRINQLQVDFRDYKREYRTEGKKEGG